MRKPEFVTITGLDEKTDVRRVLSISEKYRHHVEWGVLFSGKLEGIARRYPHPTTRDRFAKLAQKGLRLSAHLCGGNYCYSALRRPETWEDLELDLVGFRRVQLNFHSIGDEYQQDEQGAADFARRVEREVIVQCRGESFPLVQEPLVRLFDRSGGAGASPDVAWPRHPLDGSLVGYAGGLGPDNVGEQLRRIQDGLSGESRYWIDMESNVRTDDFLDLAKVERVLEIVYAS